MMCSFILEKSVERGFIAQNIGFTVLWDIQHIHVAQKTLAFTHKVT
jgi:hypothetical protein